MDYDVEQIRSDFPIIFRSVYGKPLAYFDNAATTQKPRCVIETTSEMYNTNNANVHRGVHFLSQQATNELEAARETVMRFINARSKSEIISPPYNFYHHIIFFRFCLYFLQNL